MNGINAEAFRTFLGRETKRHECFLLVFKFKKMLLGLRKIGLGRRGKFNKVILKLTQKKLSV